MATYGDVSKQFLRAIGVSSPSDAQVQAVTNWIATEKPKPGSVDTFANNPQNTTLKTPGALLSGGVQNYGTLDQGIAANAATFLESPYTGARNSLMLGDINGFYSKLSSSPWDAGHYAGGFSNVSVDTPYNFTAPGGQSNGTQPIGGSGAGNAPAGGNTNPAQAAVDAVVGNGTPTQSEGLLFYLQKFGFYLLGAALILIGLFLLFESTKAGQAVTKAAASA